MNRTVNKFLLICFLLLCGLEAYSQQDERKVVSFAAPPYSPTAHAVGASGEVPVLIAVSPEGEVVSAYAFSGHPLLKQNSAAAALKWRFEKNPEMKEAQSLVLVFSFESGESRVIEKSEQETEWKFTTEFSPPYRLIIREDILVPKLLLLPRENGVIKPKTCELHDEEMAVETVEVYRGDEDEIDLEGYTDAWWESFQNAKDRYYGYHLNKETIKAENHFCKTCRLKREQWIRAHN